VPIEEVARWQYKTVLTILPLNLQEYVEGESKSESV